MTEVGLLECFIANHTRSQYIRRQKSFLLVNNRYHRQQSTSNKHTRILPATVKWAGRGTYLSACTVAFVIFIFTLRSRQMFGFRFFASKPAFFTISFYKRGTPAQRLVLCTSFVIYSFNSMVLPTYFENISVTHNFSLILTLSHRQVPPASD